MVDNNETTQQKEKPKDSQSDKKSIIARLLPYVIMFFVAAIGAGGGFGLSRLLAGGSEKSTDANSADTSNTQSNDTKNAGADKSGSSWYYDLDPVVANLNEPSVTRYVSASLTFEMNRGYDEKKGRAFLDEKKPVIINWLTIYLSGLTIENIRGDKNLMSIKSHIRESLNETLYPGSKPEIKDVLIQKFPIQ
jgi:flagellar basal body-associated protein FliL